MNSTQGRRPEGPSDEILYDGPCRCGRHNCARHITLYADGLVEIEDVGNYIVAQLPDGVLTKPVAAPEPDWSQAPEWANWWTVDASGEQAWWKRKPQIGMGEWIYSDKDLLSGAIYGKDCLVIQDANRVPIIIDLPLGCDWRTTLRRRPEVSDDGTND